MDTQRAGVPLKLVQHFQQQLQMVRVEVKMMAARLEKHVGENWAPLSK